MATGTAASAEVSSAIARWERSCRDAPEEAVRIALELDPVLLTRGPAALHRELLEKTLALELVDPAARSTRIDLLQSLGRADIIRGLYRTARGPFEEALRIARELREPRKEGWSACFLACALAHLERQDEARALAARAVAAAGAVKDIRLRSMAEYAHGMLELLTGHHDDALRWFLRAFASAREEGSPRLCGIAFGNLSVVHRKRGEPAKARVLLAESRRAFERAGDAFHLAKIAVDQAILDLDGGQSRDGTALDAALATVIGLGDIEAEIEAREALLRLAVARNDRRTAERRWEDLAILVRSTESRIWRTRVEALRPDLRGPLPSRLRVAPDGRRVAVDDRELDFGRRGPLRRILVELTRHRVEHPKEQRPLAMADLLEVGWPHEKMRATSGAARVYMAVRRLRGLGLEDIVCTSDEGYFLDPTADVAWLEEGDVRRR